jgi:hypothetical protein
MGFDRLFLDTENHVVLAGFRVNKRLGRAAAGRRLTLVLERSCPPCRCSPVRLFELLAWQTFLPGQAGSLGPVGD